MKKEKICILILLFLGIMLNIFNFKSKNEVYLSIFIIALFLIYKINYKIFLLYYIYIYSSLFSVISLFLIEKGSYMIELSKKGYEIGGVPKLTILYIFTFIILSRNTKSYQEKIKYNINLKFFFKISIVLLLLFLLITIFLKKDMSELTRFDLYRKGGFFFKKLYNQILTLALITGVIISKRISQLKGKNLVYFILMTVISILSMIVVGEKFTGIIQFLYYLFFPLLLITNKKPKLIYSVITILFFLIVIGLNYSISGSKTIDVSKKISYRISAQSQLYWASLESNGDNVEYQNKKGLEKLMYKYSPNEIVTSYLESGIRFTNGGVAILVDENKNQYIYYGIYIYIYTIIVMQLVKFIKREEYLNIILVFKFLQIYYQGILMGNYYEIYSTKAILYIFLIFMVNILRQLIIKLKGEKI